MAKVVDAELLILRFELECSLDLFARRPEDRNLSCTLHIAWPIADLAERASVLPETAETIRFLGEAVKANGIRKHATTKRAHAEAARFDAWFTYPTAVMASRGPRSLPRGHSPATAWRSRSRPARWPSPASGSDRGPIRSGFVPRMKNGRWLMSDGEGWIHRARRWPGFAPQPSSISHLPFSG